MGVIVWLIAFIMGKKIICCTRPDGSSYRHLCNCPTAVVECESEKINATLCGFYEFTSQSIPASTPPERYLVLTNVYNDDVNCPDCSPTSQLSQSITANAARTYTFDGNGNCIEPAWSTFSRTETDSFCASTSTTTTGTIDEISGTVQSNTLKSQSYSQGAFCGGGTEGTQTRNYSSTLSNKDTEQNAIDRETPTSGTLCYSVWETRSTGFSFEKTTCNYTIECDNLVVGFEYKVTPLIRKRTAVIGSYGTWEDVTVTPVIFTATADTETIDDAGDPIELDHIQGYEYQITGATIEKTL
jgi:hypothetical protein